LSTPLTLDFFRVDDFERLTNICPDICWPDGCDLRSNHFAVGGAVKHVTYVGTFGPSARESQIRVDRSVLPLDFELPGHGLVVNFDCEAVASLDRGLAQERHALRSAHIDRSIRGPNLFIIFWGIHGFTYRG
jgi:hypothetical protein